MCVALVHASAIMHLTNVGMSSPDWPGSYGLIAASGAHSGMEAGNAGTAVAAITPVAVAERIHRAVASILQLLIIAVVAMAFLKHERSGSRRLLVPILALIISLFLAFLGVWFGSPLRYPWIMIINLLGGFALLGLFWWLTLDIYAGAAPPAGHARRFMPWAIAGLMMVII